MTYISKVAKINESIGGSLPAFDEACSAFLYDEQCRRQETIDYSSAMGMQVADIVWPKEVAAGFKRFSLTQTTRYPGLVTQKYFLEREAAAFFKRQFDLSIKLDEILLTNGSLTSPTMIMAGSPFNVVIHPDKCYSAQISTFRAAGKQTVSCATDAQGRFELTELERIVRKYQGQIAFIFLNHNQGATPNSEYLDQILEIVKTYDLYLIYDADTMATTHSSTAEPLLLLNEKYRDRFLVLTTFSKEFNCPAIRIGLAIGPPQLVHQVKVYQKHKIEILPTPSLEIARLLLMHVDVRRSANLFQQRMKKLVKTLQRLGWKIESPDIGINLFVPVPKAFRDVTVASPGALFAYHLMKVAQVMVRPGAYYGNQLASTVRFVLAPTATEIDEVSTRLKVADIHYSMALPRGLEKQFSDEVARFISV